MLLELPRAVAGAEGSESPWSTQVRRQLCVTARGPSAAQTWLLSLLCVSHPSLMGPRNDPTPGLPSWAPLSTVAFAPPASPFSFGGDFGKEIWLLLPLWSAKTRCIHAAASHLRTGTESIPLWQAVGNVLLPECAGPLGSHFHFASSLLPQVPSPAPVH